MAKIQIILFGGLTLFDCASHISAIITDETDKQKRYLVDFPFASYDSDHPLAQRTNKAINFYTRAQNTCWTKTVTLYSDQNCKAVMRAFNQIYNRHTDFSWLTNNCSDAVNLILDSFFPENRSINQWYRYYQLLCCVLCIGFIPLQCIPSPPCINTPADVFRKAEWLASIDKFRYSRHGELPQATRSGVMFFNVAEDDNPVEYLTKKYGIIS